MVDASLPVRFDEVTAAAVRLAGAVHRTPVMHARSVDERVGARVLFKCENLQRGGAFKIRGAYNALAQLDATARACGVLTYSSGNHGQAVAIAGGLLGVPAVVVMPDDAPAVKIAATRGYGAEVILYDKTKVTRETLAREIATARGLSIIPPYDHPHIVAGQGTAALELFDDVGSVDYLLVPVGGGGLLSGCALVAAHVAPRCKVIGVEPAAADDAMRSFKTGVLHSVHNPDTIADGARTPSLGALTFPMVRRYVHDIVTVDDGALLRAMDFALQRMKLLIEPTGALPLAALLEGKLDVGGGSVGVLVSGGNVDLDWYCRLRNG